MLEKQTVEIIILVLLKHQLIQEQVIAQAIYDYTKASNYLVMLPAIGYAVKVPWSRSSYENF